MRRLFGTISRLPPAFWRDDLSIFDVKPMMRNLARLVLCALWPVLSTGALAQESWIVGVKEAPPFVMRSTDGWDGLSIDLWRRIAEDLHATYEFHEYDLPGLLTAVEKGEIDVAVAALTITPERERVFDFSHGYHLAGLGIAVVAENASVRADALRDGQALLDRGSVSHNHFYLYRDGMEVSAAHHEWGDVERFADRLEAYTRGEPLPWTELFIARGRALARFGRDPVDEPARGELLRIHDEALRVGLHAAHLPPEVAAAVSARGA